MSINFEDYEVLNILGGDISSACYKVKNKKTSQIVVWKALHYETLTEQKRQSLLGKINRRKSLNHPCLLKFYDYILHNETNTLYLVMEYCKYGNLSDIVQKCLKHDEYLSENFIWNLLHNIAHSWKFTFEFDLNNISNTDIYIDEYLNVKFYYFSTDDSNKPSDVPFNVGKMFHQLCSLHSKTKHDFTLYSESLRDVIDYLLTTNIKEAVEIISHHPTVLTKISQTDNYDIYKRIDNSECISDSGNNLEKDVQLKMRLENLRNRELMLKTNELKLKEKEHSLVKREKKITLMERMIKEKLTRADLYLQRSRQTKQPGRNTKNKENNEFDTSYSADCDDSVILLTSKLLNVAELSKPKFTKTISERRVKFKAHSPLKDIHSIHKKDCLKQNQNNFRKKSKVKENMPKSQEPIDSEQEFLSNLEYISNPRTKKKFSLASVFSKKMKNSHIPFCEDDKFNTDLSKDFKRISWTEDSKKQAFKLLRIMNGDQPSDDKIIKHTCM